MSATGLLVVSWPFVLGCDAAGVVVSAGATAESKYNLHPGDHVFGCTRLGTPGYSTCQEYYLMDAALAVRTPSNVSVRDSATLGVSVYTAALALFNGLKVPIPDASNLPQPDSKDEWILVLGGASSVGKSAVQLARNACGYRVVASCSPSSDSVLHALGAQTFSYKLPVDEQVEAILRITDGKISQVFDAVASDDPVVVKKLFSSLNAAGGRGKELLFSTTNDWSGIQDFEGGKTDHVLLGPIGRAEAPEVNAQIAAFIPLVRDLVQMGKVAPSDVVVVGDGKNVWQDVIDALRFQQSGKGGNKKVVVKIGDE